MKHSVLPDEELKVLRELSGTMQVASKCGLGQTSSVAFMSILDHFGEEIARRATQTEAARS
jgi:[NiFe] hydrogenase diaphorase moiety large subunit